jgi:hypothetical protein
MTGSDRKPKQEKHIMKTRRNILNTFSGFGTYIVAAHAVTVTLDTTKTPATFSWHVRLSGGCPADRTYDALSYLGVTSRGGG